MLAQVTTAQQTTQQTAQRILNNIPMFTWWQVGVIVVSLLGSIYTLWKIIQTYQERTTADRERLREALDRRIEADEEKNRKTLKEQIESSEKAYKELEARLVASIKKKDIQLIAVDEKIVKFQTLLIDIIPLVELHFPKDRKDEFHRRIKESYLS